MTNAQRLEIRNLLAQWRFDRYLDATSQIEGLVPNLKEEVDEYYEAQEYDSLHGQIDALCDIMVFCYNVDPDLRLFNKYNKRKTMGYIKETIKQLESIKDYKDVKIERFHSYVMEIIEMCENAVIHLGYDPYLCMLETHKEINSRRGSYDEEKKKWIKDKSEEAQKLWYKANYAKCELQQQN